MLIPSVQHFFYKMLLNYWNLITFFEKVVNPLRDDTGRPKQTLIGHRSITPDKFAHLAPTPYKSPICPRTPASSQKPTKLGLSKIARSGRPTID
jgi:hypothetical protein